MCVWCWQRKVVVRRTATEVLDISRVVCTVCRWEPGGLFMTMNGTG